jgi:hypothetical protein
VQAAVALRPTQQQVALVAVVRVRSLADLHRVQQALVAKVPQAAMARTQQ